MLRLMALLDLVRGCTFDDFLLTPQFGVLARRDPSAVDLRSRFSEHLTLKRPIVSANMDTITRAAMAIVLAEEGGIGIIDRGFRAGDIAPQVPEVAAVKRTQHGVIADPHAIGPDQTVGEALRLMERTGVGTLVVVDASRRLNGLLTERDVRFVPGETRVADRMTPRDALVVHAGPISLEEAERLMVARKIKKLPLVDGDGALLGLITAKDLVKQRRHPFATRDDAGPAARGGRRRRDGRLPRARRRAAARRRRRARHRHRARPLGRDGARDRRDPRAVRRRRARGRQRRHGRGRARFSPSAASTASRSASAPAAAARRG